MGPGSQADGDKPDDSSGSPFPGKKGMRDMKRGALVGAALIAAVAAIFAVGVGGASGAATSPKIGYTPLYVSIGDGQATEGSLGAMQIKAWGTLAPGVKAEIYWSTTSGGTGTVGFDYLHQEGSYDMAAGTINCMVGSVNDNIYEPNRTFKVHIWSPDGFVVITRSTGTFTILDNDPIPTVSIGNAAAVTEGSALTFPITLSNPSYLPISVNVDSHAAGTSANWDGNDVATTPSAGALIPAYATGASHVIQTKDDSVYEGPETVVAKLASATNASIGTATGTGVVNDNDPMPVVHVTVPDHVHHGNMMNFTFTLNGQSQLPVTVNFDRIVVGHGSSASGLSVGFASLATTATYSYNPHLDHWWDAAIVTAHLTGATNAALPGGTANYAASLAIW